MDYLERYTRLITDGTPQRPEYMRYFSARCPKSRDVVHAMNDVSPCTPSLYATGKIDNGAPSADFVVHQSVEQMVEALVRADVHMDTMSNEEIGVEAHDVPADGDCMTACYMPGSKPRRT